MIKTPMGYFLIGVFCAKAAWLNKSNQAAFYSV